MRLERTVMTLLSRAIRARSKEEVIETEERDARNVMKVNQQKQKDSRKNNLGINQS